MAKIIKLTDASSDVEHYINIDYIVTFNRFDGDEYTSVIVANHPHSPVLTVKELPGAIEYGMR